MIFSSLGLRVMLRIELSFREESPPAAASVTIWEAGSTHTLTALAFLYRYLLSVFSKRCKVPLPPEQMKPLE